MVCREIVGFSTIAVAATHGSLSTFSIAHNYFYDITGGTIFVIDDFDLGICNDLNQCRLRIFHFSFFFFAVSFSFIFLNDYIFLIGFIFFPEFLYFINLLRNISTYTCVI